MADAKTPAPETVKQEGPEPLNIPGPMEAPLAMRGGEDMRVPTGPGPVGAPTGPTGPPDPEGDPGINANVVSQRAVDAARGAEGLAASRRAALVAAAALIGPSIPGGVVNRKPGEAATAAVTLAEMFIPWLQGTPWALATHLKARAAATAAVPHPATGEDDHGSDERPGPEEE